MSLCSRALLNRDKRRLDGGGVGFVTSTLIIANYDENYANLGGATICCQRGPTFPAHPLVNKPPCVSCIHAKHTLCTLDEILEVPEVHMHGLPLRPPPAVRLTTAPFSQ